MRRALPVALIALVALGAWWLHQRSSGVRRSLSAGLPALEGRLVASGLEAPLRILRDGHGVAHVEARSERDAYFGLGFVHAQDRLGQMLSLLRAAQGRTAEVLGPDGLPADRLARVVGLGRLAEGAAKSLDPETRSRLEAYAAGVSARLARVQAGLEAPPAQLEAAALPARWRPADSLAVLKGWSWSLGASLETTLVLDDLLRRLGPERARPFFPAGAGVAPAPGASPPALVESGAPFRDPLRRVLGMQARGLGSSAWVLGAAASASGKPLLVGDAHLEPTLPPHLHLAHLRGGELDVAGAAVPGVPVFWSGANRGVAWAATASRASVMDLFVESVTRGAEGEAGRVHDGRRWRPIERRSEEIAVRGAAPTRLEVETTPHGPLVNPLLEREREPLALAWAGAWPGDGIGPFLRAAHADDGESFVAALADHHEPVLALVWADAEGAAGLQVAGWIPRRGLPSGLVPVSGRSAWATWSGGLPAQRLPRAQLDARTPFLIASDGLLPAGSGREIEWLWRTGERAARLADLLESVMAQAPVSLRAVAALQLDRRAASSRAVLEPALALAGTPAQLPAEEREIHELLSDWDGGTGVDSVGAAVYHVFLVDLVRAILEPALGPELYARYVGLVHANPVPLVARVLTAAHRGWANEGVDAPEEWTRRRLAEAVRRALRETWLHFGVRRGPNRDKWRWGELHALRFRPFGLLRWDASELPAPLAYPGDASTVDAGGYDWNDPFAVRSAATWRMAIDAAELDTWLVNLAPGQGEQRAHPHRSDGVAPWAAGRPVVLLTSPVLLEERASHVLEIVPEAAEMVSDDAPEIVSDEARQAPETAPEVVP